MNLYLCFKANIEILYILAKATDICPYQGKFSLRVNSDLDRKCDFIFYLLQSITAFGKRQRVLQLLKVGYRISV